MLTIAHWLLNGETSVEAGKSELQAPSMQDDNIIKEGYKRKAAKPVGIYVSYKRIFSVSYFFSIDSEYEKASELHCTYLVKLNLSSSLPFTQPPLTFFFVRGG
jgi:hypothetical protein